VQKLILDFEKLLERYSIKVKKNSDLETKFFDSFDILYKYEDISKRDPTEDCRPLFRNSAALYDLALKIIQVEKHPDFKQLLPHLSKLNDCSIGQNSKSKRTDQDANKIIELYIASLCMSFCDHISLDHPIKSIGDNPDVIADIRGKKWGFACKTIHTSNSQTIYENIKKAIEQIERANVELGIPVINLKNVLPHDEEIWPKEHHFLSEDEPISVIKKHVDIIDSTLRNEIGDEVLKDQFKNKKSLPGILYIAQSATSVLLRRGPTPTRLHVMAPSLFSQEGFDQEINAVLDKLNYYMQRANKE
jgi:hypothetical protein